MNLDLLFLLNSIFLGIGLAMDAFSVSLANGLNESSMPRKKTILVASVFAFFQALMPMIGWILVHTLCNCFTQFERLIPWIALFLLLFIGIKMLIDGIKYNESNSEKTISLGFAALLIQGIATSIDALSVGFTISDYNFIMALFCAFIIAIITFVISIFGVIIGKKLGTKISGKASIFGGIILILIGIEIFIKGIFF